MTCTEARKSPSHDCSPCPREAPPRQPRPAASARPILAALGLDRLPTTPDRDAPGFTLDLSHLAKPDLPGTTLRPITPDDLPLLTDWRETYIGEVLGQTGPAARRRAEAELAACLTRDSH